MKKLTAISFFAGAGGLDLGIHRAGFDIKFCLEIQKKYCETLKQNNKDLNVVNGDIMEFDKQKIYKSIGFNDDKEIDLMIGGSPCQSFSTAGKRQAFSDERGKAMLKYAELVEDIKPKVFLLENVKGLLSAALKHRPLDKRGKDYEPLSDEESRGSALKYLLSQFKSYDIVYQIINSANYGVPQKRERVFFIGVRKDLKKSFEFPTNTHSKDESTNKKSWVAVKDVFEKLNIENHTYVNYSAERLKYMKMIPKGGGNWRDLPIDIAEIAMGGAFKSGGGKVGFFRRIKLHEPAPTLLTTPHQKSTNLGHPLEDRPLSIEEYKAIQGFPLDYKINGSLIDKYTQVGNAVPVKVAEILGKAIYNLIK